MNAKTWGPFTGAQLTMLGLALIAALAIPGSLWAVSASAVSITDAANGHTAAVSSGRLLFVTDTALEQSVTPANFFHATYSSLRNICLPLYTPPSGKAAIVTDVRINVYANPSPGGSNLVIFYVDANCAQQIVGDVSPPTIGHYVIPFGPGIATRTGLYVRLQGTIEAEGYADGYLVPASQVPSPPTT